MVVHKTAAAVALVKMDRQDYLPLSTKIRTIATTRHLHSPTQIEALTTGGDDEPKPLSEHRTRRVLSQHPASIGLLRMN